MTSQGLRSATRRRILLSAIIAWVLAGTANGAEPAVSQEAAAAWERIRSDLSEFTLTADYIHNAPGRSRSEQRWTLSKRGDSYLAQRLSLMKDGQSEADGDLIMLQNAQGAFTIAKPAGEEKWQIIEALPDSADHKKLQHQIAGAYSAIWSWRTTLADLDERPEYVVQSWHPNAGPNGLAELQLRHDPNRAGPADPRSDSIRRKEFERLTLRFDPANRFRLINGELVQQADGMAVTGHIRADYSESQSDIVPSSFLIMWRSQDEEDADPLQKLVLTDFSPSSLSVEQFALEHYGLQSPFESDGWQLSLSAWLFFLGCLAIGAGMYVSRRRSVQAP